MSPSTLTPIHRFRHPDKSWSQQVAPIPRYPCRRDHDQVDESSPKSVYTMINPVFCILRVAPWLIQCLYSTISYSLVTEARSIGAVLATSLHTNQYTRVIAAVWKSFQMNILRWSFVPILFLFVQHAGRAVHHRQECAHITKCRPRFHNS